MTLGQHYPALYPRGHQLAEKQFHYQCDIFELLEGSAQHSMALEGQAVEWDLFIVHPECTFLTSSGLHWNTRRPERAVQTNEALAFVERLWNLRTKFKLGMCLENPQGCINTRLPFMPKPQYIQPYQFGADASKKTGLWLDRLPHLKPTKRIAGRMVRWNGRLVERWANQTDSGQNRLSPSEDRWQKRAESYPGIASAMREQWGCLTFLPEVPK